MEATPDVSTMLAILGCALALASVVAMVLVFRQSDPCRDLDAFWTGNLGKRAAERFRAHLVDCPDCMGWIVLWGQLGDEHHDTTPGGRPGER